MRLTLHVPLPSPYSSDVAPVAPPREPEAEAVRRVLGAGGLRRPRAAHGAGPPRGGGPGGPPRPQRRRRGEAHSRFRPRTAVPAVQHPPLPLLSTPFSIH